MAENFPEIIKKKDEFSNLGNPVIPAQDKVKITI